MSALHTIPTNVLESALLVYDDCRIGGLARAAALQGITTELANRRAATKTAFRVDSEVACLQKQLEEKEDEICSLKDEICSLKVEIGSLEEQITLLQKELKTAKPS
jgi:peptidoglycan hydrolase CwlO-like protein